VGDIILLLQLKFLLTEITPMGFGLPRDDVDMPGTVFAFGDMESWKPEEMV
jgi:hypothetical protein